MKNPEIKTVLQAGCLESVSRSKIDKADKADGAKPYSKAKRIIP